MGCLRVTSVIAAFLAIVAGTLQSGLFAWLGGFAALDQLRIPSKGAVLMGMVPALHAGVPWGFTLADMPDLAGHVAVVTGANTGIGYWTARHLADAGATVVLGCRSTAKCDAAAREIAGGGASSQRVVPLALDLASLGSVVAFAEAVGARFERVDSLILNAGVMIPPFSLTADGLELQIGTNHVGHWLLARELRPRLEAAAAAHPSATATVVAVSSAAHYSSYPEGVRGSLASLNDPATYDPVKAYGQSKLANVLFAQELAARAAAAFAERGVSSGGERGVVLANSLHPGIVDSELVRHVAARVRRWLGDALTDATLAAFYARMWRPSDAALTSLFLAVSPAVRAGRVSGRYFHPIAREAVPDAHARDAALQTRLWEMTEEFVAARGF